MLGTLLGVWSGRAVARVAVAVAIGAAACASPAVAQEKTSSEFKIAVASLGNEAFDPILGVSNNQYARLIFDSLVGTDRASKDISKQTGVASDWTISEDYKTFRFRIRDGLKFQNGEELTAEDVVFSLQRWNQPKALNNPIAIDIATIKAIDPLQVEIVFTRPRPNLLYQLSAMAGQFGMIVPKDYVEKLGIDQFNLNPVGSGPYKLVNRQTGSYIRLEAAYPEHFAIGKPRFRDVIFNLVTQESTRVAMLTAGQADFIDIGTDTSAELAAKGMAIYRAGLPDPLWLFFQLQRDQPGTNDPRVRQALSLAINRKAISDALMRGIGSLTTNIFPGQAGIPDNAPAYEYDRDKARRLLTEAGFGEKGKKLSLNFWAANRPGWTQMLDIATAIQSDWRAVGVESTITYRDYGSFRSAWVGGSIPAPAVLMLNFPGTPDWQRIAEANQSCKGALTTVCNPDLDALIASWKEATTPADLERYGSRVWQTIVQNNYTIGVANMSVSYAGSKKVPANFEVGNGYASLNERGLIWGN